MAIKLISYKISIETRLITICKRGIFKIRLSYRSKELNYLKLKKKDKYLPYNNLNNEEIISFLQNLPWEKTYDYLEFPETKLDFPLIPNKRGIYRWKIVHPNGKKILYLGQTTNLNSRYREYIYQNLTNKATLRITLLLNHFLQEGSKVSFQYLKFNSLSIGNEVILDSELNNKKQRIKIEVKKRLRLESYLIGFYKDVGINLLNIHYYRSSSNENIVLAKIVEEQYLKRISERLEKKPDLSNLNILGKLYVNSSDFKAAETIYKQIYNLLLKENLPLDGLYSNLSNLYIEKKNFERAIKYSILHYCTLIDNSKPIPKALINKVKYLKGKLKLRDKTIAFLKQFENLNNKFIDEKLHALKVF